MKVMLVFNIVIILFGIYMIVSSVQMKKQGNINPMVLAKEERKKCKDVNGFIEFIYWRELVLGICMAAVGVIGVLDETVLSIGKIASYAEMLIFLAAFLWFQHSLNQARDKFLKKF